MEEKQFNSVLYEKDGNIARIALNRPEKRNAINLDVIRGLSATLDQAKEDDDIKVVILKGTGPVFSSGFDMSLVGFIYGLKEPKPGEPKSRRPALRSRIYTDIQLLYEGFWKVFSFLKPIIAQVHGFCIGWGTILAEQCDILVIAEDAKIGHSEQRIFGGIGTTATEIAHIGIKKVRYLQLTGQLIDGKEAEKMGLASKAVPTDKLTEEVNKIAHAICQAPLDGLVVGKLQHILALEAQQLGPDRLYPTAHSFWTNLRYEPGEYNFVKERMLKGVKGAFTLRDDRFEEALRQA